MSAPRPKTNRLNVYLIKSSIENLDDIISDDATRFHIDDVGAFAFEDSHKNTPEWLRKFFGSALPEPANIFAASARALLVIPIQHAERTVTFAIAFGTGRYLLKEGVVEERFGLKVALNSVDASLRSIDKTNLGSVPKHSREQMSRDVGVAEFGIDIEQDLVSAVTGRSRDPKFGKIVTGRDSLSVSVPVDISGISAFLGHCVDRYRSADYKVAFDWIDQIAEVRDGSREAMLNAALIERLQREDFDKLWMAVPEVIAWEDVAGFRYRRKKRAELHDDLHLADFLESLDLGTDSVTLDDLKGSLVHMISTSTEDAQSSCAAFRCLYGEIELDGKLYVLNNGKWYEVAADFTNKVIEDYQSIHESTVDLPRCDVRTESDYNRAVAHAKGMCCLDNDPIMHGGGHSKIEFCDLLSRDKQIIHIKRYGNSSVLSHLFAQGVVSGELFISDSEFRMKLNAKLPADLRLADPQTRPVPDQYEVVYGIMSKSRRPLDLPFFSKVSLRNARRRLTGYGYKVTLKKISKGTDPMNGATTAVP
jgi:uncharacterized protein (TIGR04141 family)